MRRLLLLLDHAWVRVWWRLLRVADLVRLVHFYHPLTTLALGRRYATPRVEHRLASVLERLPNTPASVLDVGCNVGYYSLSIAARGHLVWGIEASPFLYLVARYAAELTAGGDVSISRLRLTPENVERLPTFDCVLCLAVYHHWCREFGREGADRMVEGLLERTRRVLFFETAQSDEASEAHRRVLPDMGSDAQAWLHRYFRERGWAAETIHSHGRHLVVVTK